MKTKLRSMLKKYKTLFGKDKDDAIIAQHRTEIIEYICTKRDLLTFEEILEGLDSVGIPFNIYNDDSGRWACSDCVTQNVNLENDRAFDCVITSFIKKESWRDTLIEALDRALNELEEIEK
jgi:hypothetical protein